MYKAIIIEAENPQVTEAGQLFKANHSPSTRYPIRISDVPNSSTSYRKECVRQYLVITSDEYPKPNDWIIDMRTMKIAQNVNNHIQSFNSEIKTIICSSHPSIANISIEDMKLWVESGCPESVRLVMESVKYEDYESNDTAWEMQPKIVDGCVVFERGQTYKNTGNDLGDLAQKAMDKMLDACKPSAPLVQIMDETKL